MKHEDIGQRYLKLDDGSHDFWTFCSCGKAFRGLDPQGSYAAWGEHTDD